MTAAPGTLRLATSPSDRGLGVLRQRLQVTAETLGVPVDSTPGDNLAIATSRLFGGLVDHVHSQTSTPGLWLLMTALSGALPVADEVRESDRTRQTAAAADFAAHLLEQGYAAARAAGSAESEMDVVVDGVVVDVDFSARHELHTGIQRVVRETVPRWNQTHDLTLVAWTGAGGALRRLTLEEEDRVLKWGARSSRDDAPERPSPPATERLVVPWRSSIVLPENPAPENCPALVGAALYSGNRLALIGYDCIPALSPELIHHGLPDRFMRYLEVVKYSDRVIGISAGATKEFSGFAAMLAAQGLTGPTVDECSLPVEVPPGEAIDRSGPPLVVSIGSFEPRKNQLAVLHAAEHLWRAGLEFELQFIGGGGWATEFDVMMRRMVGAGRRVSRRTAITDGQLWGSIRAARCTVFVSLHEGFGLPVAESLACGVPCLTSDYGSTREIADGGGALVVDPRDDEAIEDALRRLLTDDALLERLRDRARARPPRTWDDYARELWTALLQPLDEETET